MPPSRPPNPFLARPRRSAALLAVAAALSLLPACGKPLLSPTDERSQFDRYDRVRNKYASQYREDEYGRQTPNLRARLSPKD